MLKVRLQRVGRKNDPSFRVVVTDSKRGPKSGNYLEMLGSYNPRQKKTVINGERVKHWISVGAQVSDTVHNILINEKVIEGKKINVLPRKSPIIKESEKVEKAESKEEAVVFEAEAEVDKSPEPKESETIKKDTPPEVASPPQTSQENRKEKEVTPEESATSEKKEK